jgi:hypothetical protein
MCQTTARPGHCGQLKQHVVLHAGDVLIYSIKTIKLFRPVCAQLLFMSVLTPASPKGGVSMIFFKTSSGCLIFFILIQTYSNGSKIFVLMLSVFVASYYDFPQFNYHFCSWNKSQYKIQTMLPPEF